MVRNQTQIAETELYGPVADFFTNLGYTVRGEVLNCDVTAVREGELIVIELKRSVNTSLLIQAIDRQRAADAVYVAVPRPAKMSTSHWKGIEKLLKRLQLGLIVVSFGRGKPRVEVAFHPNESMPRKNPRKKQLILREMLARTGDYNQGGSTRKKLMTAYRENAIFIACCLRRFGPQKPKQLRQHGTGDKTLSILRRDVYAWFSRVEKGVYALNEQGLRALSDYPELTSHYEQMLQHTTTERDDDRHSPALPLTKRTKR